MTLRSCRPSTMRLRGRAALDLKGVSHEPGPVTLLDGKQRVADDRVPNPAGGGPPPVLQDGTVLTRSMVALDRLHAVCPEQPLVTEAGPGRAQVRAAAPGLAATGIRWPPCVRGLGSLDMGYGQESYVDRTTHGCGAGVAAVQRRIRLDARFRFAVAPGPADPCRVGRTAKARCRGLDLAPFARLVAVDAAARAIPQIAAARSENRPDAVL